MEWNGFLGLFYGLLSGAFEFLPVSSQAHQKVFLKLLGLPAPGYGISLGIHFGLLVAVILSYRSVLGKYSRERKLRKQPRASRSRQPDLSCLMEQRLLKTAAVPLVVSCLLSTWIGRYFQRLWVLALLMVLGGVLVMLPPYLTRANKDARTMSPLDALLIGFGGALGILPGISGFGMLLSVASIRGVDGQFTLKFAYLLMIYGMIATCLGDLGMLLFSGAALAGVPLLFVVLACAAAFLAGFVVIRVMQFLAVKGNYEGFAYYSWGLAMFTFIIYLIG